MSQRGNKGDINEDADSYVKCWGNLETGLRFVTNTMFVAWGPGV